ncbi:MAG TPA: hypothetical protein VIL49_12700 [Capillimicrobium sp.]
MAKVALAIPDLLFGSKVRGLVTAAGHEVIGDAIDADVVVVDLVTDPRRGVEVVERLPDGVRSLGFYAHVQPDVRDRALAAGCDQVVPRSRLNREGGALVTRLAAG